MTEGFYNFHSIAYGILKIFFLLAIGYALYAKKIIKRDSIGDLSSILIWACFPALIFTKITSTFDPFVFPKWWILPISSMIMAFIGLGVGYLFQRPLKGFKSGREFMMSCAFQNSGYLPMTLVAFVCTGAFCDKVLVYIFLFLMGFNVLIWSFGPAFLSGNLKGNFKLSAVLNPPVTVTILSIVWVFLMGKGSVHNLVFDPLAMLGDSSFPLALIVLGAQLAAYRGFKSENWGALATCMFAKLIILPIIALGLIRCLPLPYALKFFIFLEATMPAAVSLVVIGQYVNADNRFLSGMIVYSHLLAIITIPAWLLIFRLKFTL